MVSVSEIADRLNALAGELAPELLPNGRYGEARRSWTASSVMDTGCSHSLVVQLHGAHAGQWKDYGNCGADEERGDMIDLLRHVRFGGHKGEAIAEAKRILGIADTFTPDRERLSPAALAELQARRAQEQRARAEARSEAEAKHRAARIKGAQALFLHSEARRIEGTPAEACLRGRGISLGDRSGGGSAKWPGSLRYHPCVWNSEAQAKLPALLAMIVTPQGEHVGTHRIWLQRHAQPGFSGQAGWAKLDSANAKKVLGTFWGGFVPVNKGASGKSMRDVGSDEAIYMCEGPEDALVIREKLPAARIVCAISLGNMGAIVFPANARRLVVVADRDEKAPEVDKLERAIAQQQARGLQVSTVLPPKGFKDVNDWAQGIARAEIPFSRKGTG